MDRYCLQWEAMQSHMILQPVKSIIIFTIIYEVYTKMAEGLGIRNEVVLVLTSEKH